MDSTRSVIIDDPYVVITFSLDQEKEYLKYKVNSFFL